MLTEEQSGAVDAVCSWFQDWEPSMPHFKLGGLAGTGKTFVVPFLTKSLGLSVSAESVVFCAYTGKAAMVLRKKGLPASTIHRLIYEPEETIDPKTGESTVVFIRKESLPENLKLIIVDEASMVGREIHEDLSGFDKPILYIGDYGQLPPIGTDFNLMDEPKLDAKLQTIHRQAAGNPIIKLSMMIRDGYTKFPFDDWAGTIGRTTAYDVKDSSLRGANQILCGMNETRRNTNVYMRDLFEYKGNPKKGERIIVLQNKHDEELVNGQQFVMTKESIRVDHRTIRVFAADADHYEDYIETEAKIKTNRDRLRKGKTVDVKTIKDLMNTFGRSLQCSAFNLCEGAPEPFKEEWRTRVQADYGYCISVHKAQGSEWDDVLLWDDGMWSWGRDKEDLRVRWLYTGVTRAAKRLIWVEDH